MPTGFAFRNVDVNLAPADTATNSSNEFDRLFATRSVSKWVLNRVEVPDVEPRRCRAISIDSNRVSVDIRVSGRPGRQAISRTDLPPSSAKSVFPFGKTRSKKSSFFVELSRICFFLRFYSRGWHQFSNEDVLEFFASFTRYTVTITTIGRFVAMLSYGCVSRLLSGCRCSVT